MVAGNPSYRPGRRLPQLPGAGVEAAAVATRLGTVALVGPAATRSALLEALPRASVAHLATHGLLREDAPASAELALAGDDSLTVPDLLGLDTDLDLVVLSACHSGRGRATSAGDVVGLARALLAAGARGLVVSLWPVDDLVGCLLMDRFHARLVDSSGVDPAAALQRAAIDVRDLGADERAAAFAELAGGQAVAHVPRDWGAERDVPAAPPDPTHPYTWAPFIHIGID